MDNRAVEELLSSFASDTFAVQSQPEKDLRASLIDFFSGVHDPDGSNLRNDNHRAAPARLSNLSISNPSLPVAAQIALSYQGNELPPPNTPLGSPMDEDIFNFPVATVHNAFSPGNCPATHSSENHTAQPPLNHSGTPNHNSFGDCFGCFHSAIFPQDNRRFPHGPNCYFDQIGNSGQLPNSNNSKFSSTHTTSQAQQAAQFNVYVERNEHSTIDKR